MTTLCTYQIQSCIVVVVFVAFLYACLIDNHVLKIVWAQNCFDHWINLNDDQIKISKYSSHFIGANQAIHTGFMLSFFSSQNHHHIYIQWNWIHRKALKMRSRKKNPISSAFFSRRQNRLVGAIVVIFVTQFTIP